MMVEHRPTEPALHKPGITPSWAVPLFCLLLVALTGAVFWPLIRYPFINYDDPVYVSENSHVAGGLNLTNVFWALSSNEGANWHPVTWWSHQIDAQLFGVKSGWHHLVSLLFHLANTVLLWATLRKMTGSTWRSGLVAAVFALHPLHVESVAWLAERKDVLSGFFFMLTLLAYVSYVRVKAVKEADPARIAYPSVFYALTALTFALGLMAKPMLVTLPFLLLLLDLWPLQRLEFSLKNQKARIKSLLYEKLPLFGLAAASSIITLLVQQGAGAVEHGLPLSVRIENAFVSYARYVLKLFWPVNLSVIYPHPVHWPLLTVLLSALLVLAISGCALLAVRRWPFVFVGWFWFVGMLVPVIGLVQVGSQSLADRYTYLPIIGLLIGLIWSAHLLACRWPLGIPLARAFALVIVLACAVATRHQLSYWRSSEELFSHAIAVTTKNPLAHNCLAAALVDSGRFDEAIEEYRKSLAYWPDDSVGRNRLAGLLAGRGRYSEAIGEFTEAIRRKPDDYASHNNLGIVLIQQGRTDEALPHFREAVRLKPGDPTLRNSLGAALARKGQLDEAINQYREALRIWPEFAKAHQGLGVTLARKGLLDEAISHLQTAVRLQPNYEEAQKNLNTALRLKAAATNGPSPPGHSFRPSP